MKNANVALGTAPECRRALSRYLVEVFAGGSHLLPGFVQQLDADAEELLEGAVVREEHGVEVVAVFAGCGKRTKCQAAPLNRTPRESTRHPRTATCQKAPAFIPDHAGGV